MPLLRPMAYSCFAVSLGPGQFKPLFCYLNPSSPVTASSICRQSVCTLQVSTHYVCGSPCLVAGGGGEACTAAFLCQPQPCRGWTQSLATASIVPVPLSGPFSIAQPEPGVLFSSSVREGTVTARLGHPV